MKLTRTLAAASSVTVAVLAAGATGYAAHSATDGPPARDLKGNVSDRTSRFAGVDRYDTAATISRNVWDRDTAVVVYLATGANYPDALAMGASTGLLGPLLFVKQDTIPEVTRAELVRLTPCEVVAVGGVGVVSDAVLTQAGGWASPASAKCSAA